MPVQIESTVADSIGATMDNPNANGITGSPTGGGAGVASSALGAAATGAAIGSAIPGLGTVTGAIVGGVGSLIAQGIGAIGNDIFGTTTADKNAQQLQQQGLLDQQQLGYSEQLQQYQLQNQEALWNYTSYQNQVKNMEAAGLNPALVYGGGGGGGQTAAANTGMIQGASAPSAAEQTQASVAQQQATQQAEAIAASANLQNVQAAKTAGVDTQKANIEIASLTQGINNQKAQQIQTEVQTDLLNIQKQIQGDPEAIDANIQLIVKQGQIAESQAYSAYAQADIDGKSAQARLDTLRQIYVNTVLEGANLKANTANTSALATVAEYHAALAKAGIPPDSPWYAKIIGGLAQKLGVTIPGIAQSAVKAGMQLSAE